MNKLLTFLQKLMDKKFFGKVMISFQSGKVTKFEMTPTIDPKEFQD